MSSRTAEGKHTTRFIIEIKGEGGKWTRSAAPNDFYTTREDAQAAIANHIASGSGVGLKFRVRQK